MEQTITIKQFVEDYNNYYNTNLSQININTHEIETIIDNLYNYPSDFDINEESITIYN